MRLKTGKKIKYKAVKTLELRPVRDFLPPPENLVLKKTNVKVTISLSQSSVEFFKQQAAKLHVPYQTMIRTVLDRYSKHYR